MLHETFPMREEGSMPYAKLVTYIQDDYENIMIDKRPLVLVCPGGAYFFTSDREAEALSLQFMAMGYHSAVLRYSVKPAVYPTALTELAASIKLIREHAEEWHVDTDKIIVLGSSAGGHLTASMGVFWQEKFLAEKLGITDNEIIKPNGLILCYPVITSGEFAHRDSFVNLLAEREEELTEAMSLENCVTDKTPKTFIWHTFEDELVPVENSLLFAGALRRAGVNTELHMYSKGAHGLCLANKLTQNAEGGMIQEECASWIGLVKTWIEGL